MANNDISLIPNQNINLDIPLLEHIELKDLEPKEPQEIEKQPGEPSEWGTGQLGEILDKPLDDIVDKIERLPLELLREGGGLLTNLFGGISDGVSSVVDAVSDVSSSAVDAVSDVGSSAVDAVSDVGSSAVDAVSDIGSSAVDAIVDFF
jgi:hypothetical protein